MTTMSTPIVVSFDLSQQETSAITDSLYRAVIGIDLNDETLFNSAWVTSADPVFQANDDAMTGLSSIHENMFKKVGPLDTTHFIQNVRMIHVSDDKKSATFMAYALAQHYLTGQGVQIDLPGRKNVLSGCIYHIDAVKDQSDGLWKMKKWAMKIIWLEGDMSVVHGSA